MKNSLINKDGEVRELTSSDFDKSKNILDIPELHALSKSIGRPKSEETKISTTIRFNKATLDYFKAAGKGWQTKMNQVLTDYAKNHS